MKPRILFTAHLFFPLATAIAALLAAPSAFATTFYWDNNNSTSGFGTALGTWAQNSTTPATGSLTARWTTDSTGATAGSATQATNGITGSPPMDSTLAPPRAGSLPAPLPLVGQ